MFVVQRAFSRVRRGYDPDEVDRHLELVSPTGSTPTASAPRALSTPYRGAGQSGAAGPRISSCTIRNAPHFGCARRNSHTNASSPADA
jgi:DivIVA domain-containing protein